MIPEHLSPARFAEAVATRLNSVVPAGLSVRAEGTGVNLFDPAPWGASWAADFITRDDGRSVADRLASAAEAIMSSIQDEVMESTKEPWPSGPPSATLPDARVIGAQLHMWFGDEANPVLRLRPIYLGEVANGAA
jgi:hypothetical protein